MLCILMAFDSVLVNKGPRGTNHCPPVNSHPLHASYLLLPLTSSVLRRRELWGQGPLQGNVVPTSSFSGIATGGWSRGGRPWPPVWHPLTQPWHVYRERTA